MHIWMALDPENVRVLVQAREFADGDFPIGLRGVGWPRAELDVDDEDYRRLLAGEVTDKEADALHRGWWRNAGGEHPWPE